MPIGKTDEEILFIAMNVFKKPGINGVLGDLIFTNQGVYYSTFGEDQFWKKGMTYPRDKELSQAHKYYGTSLKKQVSCFTWSRHYKLSEINSISCEKDTIQLEAKSGEGLELHYPRPIGAVVIAINGYPDSSQLYDIEGDPLGHYLELPKIDLLLDALNTGSTDIDLNPLQTDNCLNNQQYIKSFYRNLIEYDNVKPIIDQLSLTCKDFLKAISQEAKPFVSIQQKELDVKMWVGIFGVPLFAAGAYWGFTDDNVLLGIACTVVVTIIFPILIYVWMQEKRALENSKLISDLE